MIYYPPHLKYQYTAIDSAVDGDIAYDTYDTRPLLSRTSKPIITQSPDWWLSIILAWVVVAHLYVFFFSISRLPSPQNRQTFYINYNVLSAGQHTHTTLLQPIGPATTGDLLMGDFPRRLLRLALSNSVRAAAGTHVQDEGCGRPQYFNDVHPDPWRSDYGFEYCTQVGSFTVCYCERQD
jgi:hypothetical protein